MAVSDAVPGLSPGISHLTYHAAYAPFTPSDSEQRLGPSYYRGCWHEVSRPFLFWYYQPCELLTPRSYSQMTGVYNPKTVILHAALHHQGFPHCELFSTAATRRCLDRVSVPVCLIILSDQVPVVALVSRYLATYAPFTPSKSEQRLGPLYYRGCWHRVSRPFLFRYNQLSTY